MVRHQILWEHLIVSQALCKVLATLGPYPIWACLTEESGSKRETNNRIQWRHCLMLQITQPPSPPLLFLFWVTHHLLTYKIFYLTYISFMACLPMLEFKFQDDQLSAAMSTVAALKCNSFFPLSCRYHSLSSYISSAPSHLLCWFLTPWGAPVFSPPGFVFIACPPSLCSLIPPLAPHTNTAG